MPQEPSYVNNSYAGFFGTTQPQCYTDYRPHFNPKYLLRNIIVGEVNTSASGWEYFDPASGMSKQTEHGYPDLRPSYIVSIFAWED